MSDRHQGSSILKWIAAFPAVAISLLPNVTCPACWPAYTALLSSVGVGFVATTRYLFPLTLAFIALALFSLAWGAWRRRRFGPLVVGLIGAALLVTGRFFVPSDLFLYLGIATFISSSLWNSLLKKNSGSSGMIQNLSNCPNCNSLDIGQSQTEIESSDTTCHGNVM